MHGKREGEHECHREDRVGESHGWGSLGAGAGSPRAGIHPATGWSANRPCVLQPPALGSLLPEEVRVFRPESLSRGALVRVARIGLVAARGYGRTLPSSMPRCAHGRRPDCVTDAAQSPPARRHCEFPPLRRFAFGGDLKSDVRIAGKRWHRLARSRSAQPHNLQKRREAEGFATLCL